MYVCMFVLIRNNFALSSDCNMILLWFLSALRMSYVAMATCIH